MSNTCFVCNNDLLQVKLVAKWNELNIFFSLCLYIQVLRPCQLNCIAFLFNHWFCIEKSNTAGRFESFRRKKSTLFSQFANFDCLLNGLYLLIWAIQIEMDGGWCLFLTPNWRKIDRDATTFLLCWTTDVFRDFSLWNSLFISFFYLD